jgi:hypothetical protein
MKLQARLPCIHCTRSSSLARGGDTFRLSRNPRKSVDKWLGLVGGEYLTFSQVGRRSRATSLGIGEPLLADEHNYFSRHQ